MFPRLGIVMFYTMVLWGMSQGYGSNSLATIQALTALISETVFANYYLNLFPMCHTFMDFLVPSWSYYKCIQFKATSLSGLDSFSDSDTTTTLTIHFDSSHLRFDLKELNVLYQRTHLRWQLKRQRSSTQWLTQRLAILSLGMVDLVVSSLSTFL